MDQTLLREIERLNQKIARLAILARQHEHITSNLYKEMGYLYIELNKIERTLHKMRRT